MTNLGTAPLDTSTDVGRLRVELGDTSFQAIQQRVGFGDYAVFSDVELASFLEGAGGSILRAAGRATRRLALEYSARGRSIRTEDQTLDVKSRGSDLLAVAKAYFAEADAEEARGDVDFFEVVGSDAGSPASELLRIVF